MAKIDRSKPGKPRRCKACDGPFTTGHPATDVGSDLYHLERESCRAWRIQRSGTT